MNAAAHPVVQFQGVRKCFRVADETAEILKSVDAEVLAGEFVMITGPSGSGKSTILNLMALLDTPTGGRIIFDGQDVSCLGEARRSALRARAIGMVFQKFCLLPHRSVLENVFFRARYAAADSGDVHVRGREMVREMGLEGVMHHPVRLLSQGEMQRVAIARAVALEPVVLLADEPTGNLDAVSAALVMECFRRLNQRGITVVMVTHNTELLPFAGRHLVCRNGVLS